MLEIKEVSLSYGSTPILDKISINLQSEDILVIIGPSGCGKSSLLNVIAGNVTNYTGQVTLQGYPIDRKTKHVSLVSQNYGLLPWKTVYQNIILPLKIKKIPISQHKVVAVMERLGIADLSSRFPTNLSGGQKQRVALARSFVLDPLDILLMDEPFSALDSITREESQELFMEVWQEKKPTTLFVTHSIDEAVMIGKRIMVMSHAPHGIVEIIDNPLFGQSNIREQAAFLAQCNYIRGLIKKEWTV